MWSTRPCSEGADRRRGRFLPALLAVAFFAAGAHAGEPPSELVMALPEASANMEAAYLAADAGLYAQQGLHVKTVLYADAGALNAVAAGIADFALVRGDAFALAAAKGRRMLAIACLIDRMMIEAVLRRGLAAAARFEPSAPLSARARTLRGRVIAADSLEPMAAAYLRLIDRIAGLDGAAGHTGLLHPESMVVAFSGKLIDGFVAPPPWPAAAVAAGDAVLIASGPRGDPADMAPFGYLYAVTRPDTCVRSRALCVAMGRALAAAADLIHDRPDQDLALIAARFPNLDRSLLAASLDAVRAATPRPPAIARQGLEHADDYNVMTGRIDAKDRIRSFEGLYTNDFAR